MDICVPFKMYIFTFIIAKTLKVPFKVVMDITKMYIFAVIFANIKKYLLQWFVTALSPVLAIRHIGAGLKALRSTGLCEMCPPSAVASPA
jgi:hypothetical protein